MDNKFYRPNIIWLAIWLAIFFIVLLIGAWQTNLYWQNDLAKSMGQEFKAIRPILPYAVAYLEHQERPELLQKIVDADLGPYILVITDRAGNIKYAPQSVPAEKIAAHLKGKEFYYLAKNPNAQNSLTRPLTDQNGVRRPAAPEGEPEALGRLYLLPKQQLTFLDTLGQAYLNIFTPSESVLAFSLFSYILLLVGFAGICAITARFQNHFQKIQEQQFESELETRELRIQVLESNMKSANLRLQLLDRSHENALTKLNEADNTIARLEKVIRYESNKNEELQETLKNAEVVKAEAIAAIAAIEADRGRIAAELRELESLREVEEMNYPSTAVPKRSKEFLWLNLVYKNLQFSRRALQNIIDFKYSHDIMPSLPDALATLNNSSVEALLAGEAIPSRSVVKYTQSLAHHNGDLWEYRFSADGRIFFGLSRSRTWNIDTILLKRKFTPNRYKYEKYLQQTLGKDNDDLPSSFNS
jgi:hypothetical protein